jgi:predicted ABC-type ATPase
LAIKRVAKRVVEGGHNIPTNVIKRRYKSGIYNLINNYIEVVDSFFIYDNSYQKALLICDGNSSDFTVNDFDKWKKIQSTANDK